MKVGDLVKYKRSYLNIPIYGIIVRLGKASANCVVRLIGCNTKQWKYLSELEVISESR